MVKNLTGAKPVSADSAERVLPLEKASSEEDRISSYSDANAEDEDDM
jgi:hypothetical protein